MIPFTLCISYTKDPAYLYHFIDIIKRIPFLKDAKVNLDGWRISFPDPFSSPAIDENTSFCYYENPEQLIKTGFFNPIDIPIENITCHNTPHGERCYELIEQADTDIVFIVDSDFFCCDESMWINSYNKLIDNPDIYLVSLYQEWNWIPDLPTTPFCAYTKKILDYVPEKKLWNHFIKIWPDLKQPVFDFMKFVYVSLYMNKHTFCIDAMNWPGARLKYNHYHFWDSRDFYKDNFAEYEKEKNPTTIMFMVYGLSKFFFTSIIKNQTVIPEFIWDYIRTVKNDPFYYGFIKDFFINFSHQISFKLEWLERFKVIKKQFTERFSL